MLTALPAEVLRAIAGHVHRARDLCALERCCRAFAHSVGGGLNCVQHRSRELAREYMASWRLEAACVERLVGDSTRVGGAKWTDAVVYLERVREADAGTLAACKHSTVCLQRCVSEAVPGTTASARPGSIAGEWRESFYNSVLTISRPGHRMATGEEVLSGVYKDGAGRLRGVLTGDDQLTGDWEEDFVDGAEGVDHFGRGTFTLRLDGSQLLTGRATSAHGFEGKWSAQRLAWHAHGDTIDGPLEVPLEEGSAGRTRRLGPSLGRCFIACRDLPGAGAQHETSGVHWRRLRRGLWQGTAHAWEARVTRVGAAGSRAAFVQGDGRRVVLAGLSSVRDYPWGPLAAPSPLLHSVHMPAAVRRIAVPNSEGGLAFVACLDSGQCLVVSVEAGAVSCGDLHERVRAPYPERHFSLGNTKFVDVSLRASHGLAPEPHQGLLLTSEGVVVVLHVRQDRALLLSNPPEQTFVARSVVSGDALHVALGVDGQVHVARCSGAPYSAWRLVPNCAGGRVTAVRGVGRDEGVATASNAQLFVLLTAAGAVHTLSDVDLTTGSICVETRVATPEHLHVVEVAVSGATLCLRAASGVVVTRTAPSPPDVMRTPVDQLGRRERVESVSHPNTCVQGVRSLPPLEPPRFPREAFAPFDFFHAHLVACHSVARTAPADVAEEDHAGAGREEEGEGLAPFLTEPQAPERPATAYQPAGNAELSGALPMGGAGEVAVDTPAVRRLPRARGPPGS